MLAFGPAVVAVVFLIYWVLRDWALFAGFLGGLLGFLLALALAGALLVRLAGSFRSSVGVAWRYGIANLSRRRTESVVQIDGKVALYGGLDCATDWKYDAAKQTLLTASNDMVPVSVSSGARLDMYDVNVQADDALAPGGSSIGILAEADADVDPRVL